MNFEFNQRQIKRFEFLNNLDTGVMKILIPFLLIKMGISMSVFGLALSLTPLMNVTFRFFSSYLSDQFGRKTMSMIGQLLGAFCLLGYCFMSNMYHYIILEALRAFASILFIPSYKAWTKESCKDNERVDFLMKLSRNRVIGTAVGGGLIIGMGYIVRIFNLQICGIAIHEQHFFAIFFIFEFLAVFLLLFMEDSKIKNQSDTAKISIRESVYDWNVFLFMMYNSAALSLAGAVALPFATAYITERMNLSVDKVGAFFAISSVAAVLLSQKIIRVLKYARPFKIIGILLFLEGIASLLIPMEKGIVLFTLIWVLYQIFQSSVDVLNNSQEQRIIKANTAQMLQFTGIAGSIGMVIGNNLGGLIWHNLGSQYTYWIAGVLIVIISSSEICFDFFVKNSVFGLPVNLKKAET